MARKSFKDNPALQFISVTSAPGSVDMESTQDTFNTQDTHNTHNTQGVYHAHDAYNTRDAHGDAHGDVERKTKRLNLLMRPSLLRDIAKIAHMRRQSVNDLIGTVLEGYRQEQMGEIEEFDRVFGG